MGQIEHSPSLTREEMIDSADNGEEEIPCSWGHGHQAVNDDLQRLLEAART
jgi:hypothetical protein